MRHAHASHRTGKSLQLVATGAQMEKDRFERCTLGPFNFMTKIPQLLRRKTSTGWFVPQIDGLRFIAILFVVISHVVIYTTSLTQANDVRWLEAMRLNLARGVELFFVISGFVIAMPFVSAAAAAKPPVRLREYFLRRLTRLEPPFIVAMLLTFAALVLVHGMAARPLLGHMLATCTYTHGLIYRTKSPIAFITWSLEIEVQFYIVAPAILRLLRFSRLSRRLALASVGLTAAGATAFLSSRSSYTTVILPAWLCFFVSGIIVADLAQEAHFWTQKLRSFYWDAFGIVAAVVAFALLDDSWANGPAGALLYGICLLAAFRGKILASYLSLPWITATGGMCYTIYLFHERAVYFLGHITRLAFRGSDLLWNLPVQFALMLPLLFVVCSVLFLILEKPCMNKHWPRDLAARFAVGVFPPSD
jgi:peptidoglycan/LPS O-acetylase OafA/YrhL